jgi:tripartite-type tricarboxylate transporter receptor subunit TctC
LPNLASAHEQKLADFEAPPWFAVFLPRGASEPIIRKLNQAAFATADTRSLQERLNVLANSSRSRYVDSELDFGSYCRSR